ncbi:Homoserine/homoserine lactone efflux protein [Ephemeroptericola cinctiostellae]|uniref:Homoserine/homoserine lactone efflux protein n=1 Tax=Ephemeroptericola cinctiostellae TaxID=2268024 RepID=A0A345D8W9_9BURK|nr:LysE family translocator [Ephemeroptericola cinctiostellae]AXF84807.1 Homoserine/homoserine lactone efflux protein [Ephemeroptericola cinctiostellae]
MHLPLLFITMATLTILSPGPGVLRSLTNALNYGLRPALVGILGTASGTFCIATLSATSLGALLAASNNAFTIIKYIGAAYLIYLGIKLWRAPAIELDNNETPPRSPQSLFIESFFMQFSNPKAIVFFLSIFPQFIDPTSDYAPQFIVLVCTFCALLFCIHATYAFFAQSAKRWFSHGQGGRWMNRIGGTTFIGFGLMLAQSKKAAQ